MTDETHDEADEIRARMEDLTDKARALMTKMGIHEQLRLAHENRRTALLARADAEVAYMDLRMQRRDEWKAASFGAQPINDAGDCAASAATVRAYWRHEEAELHYRRVEVAWLEWVAASAPVKEPNRGSPGQ